MLCRISKIQTSITKLNLQGSQNLPKIKKAISQGKKSDNGVAEA